MIKLYKRRHSAECLAEIEKRLSQGKLKPPHDKGAYLAQYRHCRCKWWARGTNKFGQSMSKRSTGCDLLVDAEVVKEKLYNTNLEEQPKESPLTIQQVLEKWDARKLRGTPENPRPETTRDGYLRIVSNLIAFIQKGEERPVYFDEVTPSVLYDLQALWTTQGLAASSNNQYRTHLSSFFTHAIRSEEARTRDGRLITVNPITKLDRLPVNDKVPTLPLDPEEGDANWQLIRREIVPYLKTLRPRNERAIRKHPQSCLALLELMYYTGLRISDAVKFIPAKIIETPFGNLKYTTQQTKSQRPVTCFLPRWLAEKLRSLPLLNAEKGYPFWDGALKLNPYITNEIRLPLFQLGEKFGINDQIYEVEGVEVQDNLRPHRFRDSFATNQILAGCDIRELSRKLGHKSVKTTEDHYLPWIKKREQALELNHYKLNCDYGDNVIEISTRKAG